MMANDDRARLITSITIAAHFARPLEGATFEQRLQTLGRASTGPDWTIPVARDLRPGFFSRIDHPWHCYKLEKLLVQLNSQALDPVNEDASAKLLARCCAMVQFGVDVNATWLRRLRELEVDKQVSHRELKSLLRHTTIWWGTSKRASKDKRFIRNAMLALWSMGRPEAGELLIRQHHFLTKAAVILALAVSGIAFGTTCWEFIHYIRHHGVLNGGVELFTFTLLHGAEFWISWWIGPGSWAAASRLARLLEEPRKKRDKS